MEPHTAAPGSKVTPAEIAVLLNFLSETPRRIALACRDFGDDRLRVRADETSWSANDILAHLRAGADVWGKSIAAMITQDQPTLRYVSPRTWIKKTDYPELEFRQSLQTFVQQRDALIKLLESLASADWSRGATFTGTTRGREGTVLGYVQRMVQHENEHCEQIEALLK
jgi:uncharacterized damage-inducible protein DinB